MKKIYSLLVLMAFGTQITIAQDSTRLVKTKSISAEELIGHNRQFFQLMVNKTFVEQKKIGLLSLTAYAADYKNNLGHNEFLNTTLIYHSIFKGISINSGASFTTAEGLKNFVGLQYMYQGKQLSFVYIPGYYFIESHKISNLALIEYKPSLTTNWSVYTRLQVHYNYDLKNENHFRSYAYSRLGLTYKNASFGLAHNFDRYGSVGTTKNNSGVFLNLSL